MEDNKILDVLYSARLEEISKNDKRDMQMLEGVAIRISEFEAELDECLSKLENEDLKNEIKQLIEERIEIEEDVSSYIKEKFYKFGFLDIRNLLLNG